MPQLNDLKLRCFHYILQSTSLRTTYKLGYKITHDSKTVEVINAYQGVNLITLHKLGYKVTHNSKIVELINAYQSVNFITLHDRKRATIIMRNQDLTIPKNFTKFEIYPSLS